MHLLMFKPFMFGIMPILYLGLLLFAQMMKLVIIKGNKPLMTFSFVQIGRSGKISVLRF